MMKENEIFKLKQELKEVKDLVQEVLRRFGELEFRGLIKYGEPNNISRHNVSFDVKLSRMHKGKLVREVVMEEKKSWDKLKEIKLDIPKSSTSVSPSVSTSVSPSVSTKVSPNRKPMLSKPKAVKHDESKIKKIDQLEWLNLLNEIRTGMDAFQMGDFKLESTREQISGVILNRVKKWYQSNENL
jgi:hypothetical protein